MRRKLAFSPLLLASAIALVPSVASGSIMNLGVVFSGDTPSGSGPWLKATFADDGSGGVKLTLDATNLDLGGTGEFISNWYFNTTLDPTSLSFSSPTKTGSFTDPSIIHDPTVNPNDYKADGDGYFDIVFGFDVSQGGTGATRFGHGDIAVYTITRTGGVTAADFNDVSSGNKGGYYSAAHVQGIAVEDSGWIAANDLQFDQPVVPEPASVVIWGVLGAGGAAALALRRRNRVPVRTPWSEENRKAIFEIVGQGRW